MLTLRVIILYNMSDFIMRLNMISHKPIANLIPTVNNSLLLVVVMLVVVVHRFAPMGLG
jgi:hypothetical protein